MPYVDLTSKWKPPVNPNTDLLNQNFAAMMNPANQFNLAKGPQNYFNEPQLAALNAQGLNQLQAAQSGQNAGAAQSAASRGIAGPNFANMYSGANNAAMRGSLAQGDLAARLKGLELGNQQYQSFADATKTMGSLSAEEADRQRQIWAAQQSTDLAQQLQLLTGEQSLANIGAQGTENRALSAQEAGQTMEQKQKDFENNISTIMQQFQNATTMQEKADLQQEYMAELNAYINFMSDPGLISSYVSSDEGSKLRRGLNQVMDLRVRDLNNALARKGSFTSGIYDPSAPNVAGTAGGGIQSTLGQPFEMPDFMQRQQVGQGGIETVWDYIPMGFGAGPAGEGTLNTEGVPTLEALRSKFETETNEPGKWSQQMMLDFNRFANTPAGKEMIDQFIPKKNYGGWRLNDLFDAAESAGLLDIGGWRWTKSDTGRPAGT